VHRRVQPGGDAQRSGGSRVFPGQGDVVAAEVAVGGSLPVDGPAQVQVADDGAGAQVEVLLDQRGDLLVGDAAGAEGLTLTESGCATPMA
jgi:hypothetical protein